VQLPDDIESLDVKNFTRTSIDDCIRLCTASIDINGEPYSVAYSTFVAVSADPGLPDHVAFAASSFDVGPWGITTVVCNSTLTILPNDGLIHSLIARQIASFWVCQDHIKLDNNETIVSNNCNKTALITNDMP
jgi:hypothetical protein